jgi:hypothetical protein
LNDEGYTIPAAVPLLLGHEAMQSIYLKVLRKVPEQVTLTAEMVAANAAHSARLLKSAPYAGVPQTAGEHAKEA